MPYYPPATGVSLTIQDEGVTKGTATTLDFVGSGVVASVAASTGTVTVSGGTGTFAVTQTEVDFGSAPVQNGQFTISDAGIVAGQKMIILLASDPYTGKGTNNYDEAEMDDIVFMPRTCTTGACVVHWVCDSKVKGNFKVNWTVA